MSRATRDETVIWHDVECGGYAADLPLWRELAAGHAEPVLELGCGTGRVALDLASRGHSVTAIDNDAALVNAVRERARERGLEVAAEVADARRLELEATFGLIAAPMQMLQLVTGAGERAHVLRAARARLAPGGAVALAVVEGVPGGGGDVHPLPDVAEIDGWVYSSLPLEILDQGERMLVTRLRQVVAPDGALTESVDRTYLAVLTAAQLEAEASSAGLRTVGRHAVATTAAHVGSTVVLLGGAE
jgi:SAM-dependent methyltransferase